MTFEGRRLRIEESAYVTHQHGAWRLQGTGPTSTLIAPSSQLHVARKTSLVSTQRSGRASPFPKVDASKTSNSLFLSLSCYPIEPHSLKSASITVQPLNARPTSIHALRSSTLSQIAHLYKPLLLTRRPGVPSTSLSLGMYLGALPMGLPS